MVTGASAPTRLLDKSSVRDPRSTSARWSAALFAGGPRRELRFDWYRGRRPTGRARRRVKSPSSALTADRSKKPDLEVCGVWDVAPGKGSLGCGPPGLRGQRDAIAPSLRRQHLLDRLTTITAEALGTCRAAPDERVVAAQGVASILRCDRQTRSLLAMTILNLYDGKRINGMIEPASLREPIRQSTSRLRVRWTCMHSASWCGHHVTSGNPEIACDLPVGFSGRPEVLSQVTPGRDTRSTGGKRRDPWRLQLTMKVAALPCNLHSCCYRANSFVSSASFDVNSRARGWCELPSLTCVERMWVSANLQGFATVA
jgi:hypothetical protein